MATGGVGVAADFPSTFSGNLLGSVVDSFGTPQMGASVVLYDHYQRLVRRTLTSGEGRFGFAGLSPEQYSIRVSIPSLIPATRDKITVRAGLSSVLEIRMASLFSTVEFRYSVPTAVMSDDWKWVLRASSATRAVTRFIPQMGSSTSENSQKVFSDVRGLVSLSAGDAGSMMSDIGSADFGTSFALNTSVYGRNQLGFSAAFGQSIQSGMPTMGARLTYARSGQDGEAPMPEITIMARQVVDPRPFRRTQCDDRRVCASIHHFELLRFHGYCRYHPSGIRRRKRIGRLFRPGQQGEPLRTCDSFFGCRRVHCCFFQRRQRAERPLYPSIRARKRTGGHHQRPCEPAAVFAPRLPLQLQRTQNFEAGYVKTAGQRTFAVSAFYEGVKDGRLSVAGDLSSLNQGDVLSDVSTDTSIYNIGTIAGTAWWLQ